MDTPVGAWVASNLDRIADVNDWRQDCCCVAEIGLEATELLGVILLNVTPAGWGGPPSRTVPSCWTLEGTAAGRYATSQRSS
ncbi:hypothetical protein ACN26Z_01510 [Verrucosispora sp. WMMD703]|uniref:hypothetical protein n=1 Tax=Verrucosispora sp. WMMD703 TaxID=3403463 RepID=UPI003B93882F